MFYFSFFHGQHQALQLVLNKPFLGSFEVPHTIWPPIGSAVLTFIGYKLQKGRQTDRPKSKVYTTSFIEEKT